MLEKIAIVLVEPREPGNIGATARAMANMGLSRLILDRPPDLDLVRIPMDLEHDDIRRFAQQGRLFRHDGTADHLLIVHDASTSVSI